MKTAKTNNNVEAIEAINSNDVKRALALLVAASQNAVYVGYEKVKDQIVVAAKAVHKAAGLAWSKTSNPEGLVVTTLAKIKDMGLNICQRVWNAFSDFFKALFVKQVTA